MGAWLRVSLLAALVVTALSPLAGALAAQVVAPLTASLEPVNVEAFSVGGLVVPVGDQGSRALPRLVAISRPAGISTATIEVSLRDVGALMEYFDTFIVTLFNVVTVPPASRDFGVRAAIDDDVNQDSLSLSYEISNDSLLAKLEQTLSTVVDAQLARSIAEDLVGETSYVRVQIIDSEASEVIYDTGVVWANSTYIAGNITTPVGVDVFVSYEEGYNATHDIVYILIRNGGATLFNSSPAFYYFFNEVTNTFENATNYTLILTVYNSTLDPIYSISFEVTLRSQGGAGIVESREVVSVSGRVLRGGERLVLGFDKASGFLVERATITVTDEWRATGVAEYGATIYYESSEGASFQGVPFTLEFRVTGSS